MFRAVFEDARKWRYIVETVHALVEEAEFKATPDGLSLKAIDRSKVAMVELELPSHSFEDYACEKEMKIGVNLDEMRKVMRRCRAGDKLELEADPQTNRIILRFRGAATRTFKLPLLRIGAAELRSPNVPIKAKVEISAKALEEAIKDAATVSDSLEMRLDETGLTIVARGELGDVEVKIDQESGALITEPEIEEPAHASYSIEHLENILKAVKASETVVIGFATNAPLKMDFNITGGGKITYYLAPRAAA